MNYATFIDTLGQHVNKSLVFAFNHGLIQQNYHITEVMKQHTNAIDCGGALDEWDETLIQLLEPSQLTDDDFMPVQKAVDIFGRSDQKLALLAESEVVLEYKAKNLDAVQRFFIEDINVTDNAVIVKTRGARTQCKAMARKKEVEKSCCAAMPEGAQAARVSRCCS